MRRCSSHQDWQQEVEIPLHCIELWSLPTEEKNRGGDFVVILVCLFQGKRVLWPQMVLEVTT